jgi:CBS domain-containing protein
MRVTDLMRTPVDHAVRRLPVVDEHGRPHGVVPLDDLLRQLGRAADAIVDAIRTQTPASYRDAG